MQLLRQYALQLVGIPYAWGGDDPLKGFDCSGLVIELLQSCGELPRAKTNGVIFDATSQQLHDLYELKGVMSSVGAFGALAFFGKSTSKITHIGFMMDNKRMLEAGGGGSQTIDFESAARHNAYTRIRPITWRKDLVAILKPRYSLTNNKDW